MITLPEWAQVFNVRYNVLVVKYFDRCNYTDLNEDIANTDWVQLLAEENDIDTNWCKFHGIIMKIEDKHIPTKTIKLSSKGKRVFLKVKWSVPYQFSLT
jgi:hypothetical protein